MARLLVFLGCTGAAALVRDVAQQATLTLTDLEAAASSAQDSMNDLLAHMDAAETNLRAASTILYRPEVTDHYAAVRAAINRAKAKVAAERNSSMVLHNQTKASKNKVNTSVKAESKVNTPVKVESNVNTPVKVESKVNTPVEVESKVNTPVKVESKVNTPVKMDRKVNTTVKVESTANSMDKVNVTNASTVSAVVTNSSSPQSENRTENLMKEKQVLKNLMAKFKDDIGRLNKDEDSGAAHNKATIANVTARLAEDRKMLQNKSISETTRQALLNRTEMEERELQYWSKSRELGKHMYHANLRMTHGMMSKVKKLMEAYDSVLSNKTIDPTLAKSLHLDTAHRNKNHTDIV